MDKIVSFFITLFPSFVDIAVLVQKAAVAIARSIPQHGQAGLVVFAKSVKKAKCFLRPHTGPGSAGRLRPGTPYLAVQAKAVSAARLFHFGNRFLQVPVFLARKGADFVQTGKVLFSFV